MKLIPTNNRQVINWLLAITLCSAGALYLGVAEPTRNLQTPTPEDEWQLPTLAAPIEAQALYAKLNTLQPWGKELENASKTNKNQSTNKLQLVGIVKEGGKQYILLSDGQKITRYTIKDTLPDETVVISIDKNTVTLQRTDTEETLKLYAPKPTS
ncbi:hypothetical protein [Beggiatoa leptomitoformis]|uniref:Type II secretion system protein GspC N-terminal domain-containing protein n=1 Tax=Beggiatoa leptomitoformis TaxID=288004 RepID=A0A2N9YHF9_9GAMM|nr:hypothetical protein [Beggiatoa leptomitoformis]ALG67808.1 hypothetical protein AL038_08950 [Beggiatoa leptomitoformis]AUI69940.1 hypothetical protein BLE401_15360 [Beggiatoa leptomitoformis]